MEETGVKGGVMPACPITVFDTKDIPGNRRERIEAAVVAAGANIGTPYEAWILADPFRGGFAAHHRQAPASWVVIIS